MRGHRAGDVQTTMVRGQIVSIVQEDFAAHWQLQKCARSEGLRRHANVDALLQLAFAASEDSLITQIAQPQNVLEL